MIFKISCSSAEIIACIIIEDAGGNDKRENQFLPSMKIRELLQHTTTKNDLIATIKNHGQAQTNKKTPYNFNLGKII